ncbi:hypothetical protein BpHYR1_030698 [Brachionus plicatilis]|uniref:Uncharacterized protein n=1 Tax=Brachionus plicatilis TaxID=10195 RepID=A0A3M7SFJ8_BRAPC|nr:hypothetical protein BpHYR1_030698 [Brachionus plicatilis]
MAEHWLAPLEPVAVVSQMDEQLELVYFGLPRPVQTRHLIRIEVNQKKIFLLIFMLDSNHFICKIYFVIIFLYTYFWFT